MRSLCLICAILLTGCDLPPDITPLSNGALLSVSTQTVRRVDGWPERLQSLQRLELSRASEPYRFTISPEMIPAYSVFSGQEDDGTLVIATVTPLTAGRDAVSIFEIADQSTQELRLSSAPDWFVRAGPEPLARLEDHKKECEKLPALLAQQRYGFAAMRDDFGRIAQVTEGLQIFCPFAMHHKSYGIIVALSDRRVLISSIVGEVFIEEVQ